MSEKEKSRTRTILFLCLVALPILTVNGQGLVKAKLVLREPEVRRRVNVLNVAAAVGARHNVQRAVIPRHLDSK
jgi:hypothetical protein